MTTPANPARSRPRRALAASPLAVALALTGCSGSDEQAGGPIPSGPAADPTTHVTAPVTPDGPPPLPTAAREHSSAGAKAFVRYYFEALDYAWLHVSGDPIRANSAASCAVCSEMADGFDQVAARGGYQRGGRHSMRSIFAIPGQPSDRPILAVSLHIRAFDFAASRHAAPQHSPAQLVRYSLFLAWTQTRWTVTDLTA